MYIQGMAQQTLSFLLCIGMGFALGLLYDLIRLIRRSFFKSKASFYFLDILYFVICTFAVFFFFICINGGEVRGYLLFGLALGWLTYYFTLHSSVCRLTDPISSFVSSVLVRFRLFAAPKCRRIIKKALNLLKKAKIKQKGT